MREGKFKNAITVWRKKRTPAHKRAQKAKMGRIKREQVLGLNNRHE